MVIFRIHSQEIRDMVIKHHNNRKTPKQIVECLAGQVPKPTVYRWISELISLGIYENRFNNSILLQLL